MSTLELENIKHPDNSGDNIALASNGSITIDRKSTDGTIAEFRKDGTSVGSIGVGDNDNLYISGHAGSTKGLYFNDNTVGPVSNGYNISDNTTNLGAANARFKDAYLSGGVYLGGTGSANKLDDYEEGTWTPVTSSGTMNGGSGSYVKIGSFVTLIFRWSSISSGSGQVSITGLPFTRSTSSHLGGLYPASGNCMFDGINTTRGIAPYLASNNITFYGNGSGNSDSWWYLQHSDANGGTQPLEVYGSIWYYTDQ
jgi:hypothetical protein